MKKSFFSAFNAGIEPHPVMCQTVNATLVNSCTWASCGEWCLTKTTGFCPQIHATVRRNGTDIIFENCTNSASVFCPQVRIIFWINEKKKGKFDRILIDP